MDDLVFLLDVDNTLLDNDRAKEDMAAQVEALVGAERAKSWWELYEQVRRETDVVDYPRTLTRYRAAFPDEPRFPHLADYILGLPYDDLRLSGRAGDARLPANDGHHRDRLRRGRRVPGGQDRAWRAWRQPWTTTC